MTKEPQMPGPSSHHSMALKGLKQSPQRPPPPPPAVSLRKAPFRKHEEKFTPPQDEPEKGQSVREKTPLNVHVPARDADRHPSVGRCLGLNHRQRPSLDRMNNVVLVPTQIKAFRRSFHALLLCFDVTNRIRGPGSQSLPQTRHLPAFGRVPAHEEACRPLSGPSCSVRSGRSRCPVSASCCCGQPQQNRIPLRSEGNDAQYGPLLYSQVNCFSTKSLDNDSLSPHWLHLTLDQFFGSGQSRAA